jgi:hypothetical protein
MVTMVCNIWAHGTMRLRGRVKNQVCKTAYVSREEHISIHVNEVAQTSLQSRVRSYVHTRLHSSVQLCSGSKTSVANRTAFEYLSAARGAYAILVGQILIVP